MVHQHFMLVEVFTVAENLILGREDSKAGCSTWVRRDAPSSGSRNATGWT